MVPNEVDILVPLQCTTVVTRSRLGRKTMPSAVHVKASRSYIACQYSPHVTILGGAER